MCGVCVFEGHFYLTIRAGRRLKVFVNRVLRKAYDRSNGSMFQERNIDAGRRILWNLIQRNLLFYPSVRVLI